MILEGTTSSGAVVPVQVTTDGKVVAEGRTGQEGPQGPEGPEGPQGPEGPAGSPGNLWSGSDPGPISYSGGSVGIGTATPAGSLDVQGKAGAENTVFLTNGNTGDSSNILQTRDAAGTLNGAIRFSSLDSSIQFLQDTTERVRIDGSGRVLVGQVGSMTAGTQAQYAKLQVIGSTASATAQSIISLGRGQDASAGITANNDVGYINFTDNQGNEFAQIGCITDASTGAGSNPGRLVFSTTADGATSPTERLRIDSRGDVVFQGAPIIRSPDGSHWAIEVDNNGNLSAVFAI